MLVDATLNNLKVNELKQQPAHDLTVVSRAEDGFRNSGVRVTNPFSKGNARSDPGQPDATEALLLDQCVKVLHADAVAAIRAHLDTALSDFAGQIRFDESNPSGRAAS
jgi:hypothetical protein